MIRHWLAGHKSLVMTMTSGGVIAALVATLAVVSGGYPAQKVELNDASVWVANGSKQLVGRANTEVLELNSVVESSSSEVDVVQSGASVFVLDEANNKVDVIDPATSSVLDTVPMPTQGPRLFLAGGNIVVTDRNGEVWILPLSEFDRFDTEAQPTLSLGGDSVFAMSGDGTLIAFSQAAKLVYRIDAARTLTVEETHRLDFGTPSAEMTITSVGTHWAVLNQTGRALVVDGNAVDLSGVVASGDRPQLQEPSGQGDRVLVGYSGGLLSVPVLGGNPDQLVDGRSGLAAPPLLNNGCTFAAWSDGAAWRQCQGDGDGVQLSLASMLPGSVRLTFAHNGERVMLNDPRGGGSWAVQDRGQLIDNWDELATVRQDQQQIVENDLDTPPDYEKTQQPPVAVDDAFGARPGRSAVFPVLLNDYDPNGDVLVISQVTTIPETVGRLDLINNRQQIQLALAAGAHGTVTFNYSITDGRGGEDTATVTVTIRTPEENSAPVQLRKTKTLVAQGGRVSTSVLGDWVDPDGDAMYLASAATAPPDTVSFKPEGTVMFIEGGAAAASRAVALVVTDGTAQGSGSLTIAVSPRGKVPIVADPFVLLAYAGQEITVKPLEHVRGGTGTLRLSSVPAKTGATITPSLEAGTFRFSSTQVRTFNLEYLVDDGDQTATGIVRIDVAAQPDANSKPITIPKTIFVKTLSSQTIDVAGSDIDPAGGVLLVTGVYNIAVDSGVQAEILDQRSVRVTLTAPLDQGPVGFNYRISNGLAEAEGIITVIEIPQPARLQPPVATDDTISVRVGAAIDIPVLDNDVQPDGEELTLNPQLSSTLTGDSGLLFASGNILRYLAPDKPGNFTASYRVSGPDGQTAEARVNIAVRETVEATNNAPVPVTVIARVLAGESVNIRIPLSGIDPDGDAVQLLGQETNPEKGAVVAVGSDSLQYEAGSYSAGTDSFTYTVIDTLGARATGLVRIGITQRLDGARNPVAIPDEVSMRPGGTVTIRVLANDSDPDGSALSVISVEPTKDATVLAETDGEVVSVTPPDIEGQYGLIYTIQNEFGGTSSNFITVNVAADAPRAYPIANDSVLTLTDIIGRNTIDVNVLANVFFADGPTSSLGVSLLPGYDTTATVTDKKRITVTVGQKRQIIPFAVTNPDDPKIVSYAFVWVPGYDDALPQLNRKARPLVVASESTLIIPLNDYVVAIGGKQVRLADTTTVRATNANGDDLVVDDRTLTFTSADKYFGPASISFEVTDGSSANDPAGRTATLVLPITVTPRSNQPPVFNGAVIDFEPGEEKVLDLLKLTTYPYPDDLGELAYTALAPLPEGFSYTLTGQSLTVRANEDAVKGQTTAIVIGVRDDLAEGKTGSIRLSVVASSKPLAQPASDSAIVPRGKTTVIDVLSNDEATNPFPDTPLTVVGAIRGLDGSSVPAGVTIVPSANNSRLSVTVGQDTPAQDVYLQYQVADATKDPSRYVWGTIRLEIQDVPDPVTNVRVLGFGDQRVTVAWSPGGFNNSPITGYEVTATRVSTGQVASVTQCSGNSGCDIRTPGNGPDAKVRISVVAINAIGPSEPASAGSAVWSDVLPAAPGGISAVPTNANPTGGAIAVSWSAVPDPAPGTPLVGYTVRVSGPGVDLLQTVPASSTSLSYPNSGGVLVPGVQYAVTVYARNSAQVSGEADWRRNAAVAVTAVGPPTQTAGGVTGVVVNAQGHIQVSWGASDPQGAPGVTYTVGRFDDTDTMPTACRAATPGSGATPVTSGWIDTHVQDQHSYRYVVYADNGYYCTPTASGAILTMRPPGKASGSISLQPHGGQFDIQVGNDLAVAGLSAAKFEYQVNGTGSWAPVVEGQWLTSIANAAVYGNDLTITFRGCRDASDSFCGLPSDGMTLRPVNARASIVSCVIGEQAVANPPVNAGLPTVTFLYSFNRGGIAGWSPFGTDATVPSASAIGTQVVTIRVKAVVDFGTPPSYTDPGFAEGTCSP
ncbi:MAG TPA: Ig-like domain-containing protein [Terrimesophilobacter sp.]|uniref:Ig-like domain-containing protein n=1 Tax=Terrimesophilobacter sp. TaxID=2906435 RepID=UPI002F955757